MLRMAIGAGGRLAVAGGDGFAMNAGFDIFGRLVVASAASLGQPGEVQRRGGRVGRQDGVAVVAVAARGGAFLPFGQGEAVDTGAVALGLLLVALAQSGGCAGTLSSGCLEVRSAWQLAQVLVLWTEAASLATSTNKETSLPAALVLVSVLSEWQSRQALFLIGSAADAAAAAEEGKKGCG